MSPTAAIHVVTDPGVPVFGAKGASVHCQEVVRELVRRYPTVHLVTTRPGGDPPPDLAGLVVHLLPRPSGADLAAREAAQRDADVAAARIVARLCATGDVGLVYVRYALWSAAVLEVDVPTVLEINAPLPEEQARHRGLHDPEAALAWTRRALAAADAPFAVSGPVARWAATLDPRGRRVPTVPNGVDVARFAPSSDRHAAAAPDGARSTPGSGLTVAFTGTFKPWHGTELLVDAVAAARGRGADLDLLLVGDGPRLGATVDRAAAAGVATTVTGGVDPAAVPRWLRRADLAVAPYPAAAGPGHYFSPLKVTEYLAAGLPTVAAAIADVGDLVRDGEEALLVPPGDLEALAAALHRLAGDPRLRARLARAGRAAAVARMSWEATVTRSLAPLGAAVGA